MHKWVPIVTRRVVVFRTFITARGSHDEVQRYLGVGCDYLAITKNDQCSVYLAAKDTKRVSEEILKRLQNDKNFGEKHAEDCRQACAARVRVSQESAANVDGRVSTEELKQRFLRYCDEYICFAKFMAIPVAIERIFTTRISEAIRARVGEARLPEFLAKLMTPPKFSEFQKEQVELLELAIECMRLGVDQCKTAIEQHAKKYRWISCYNIDETAYSDEYFTGRIQELCKLSTIELEKQHAELAGQQQRDEHAFQSTLEELRLEDDMVKEIALLRSYVYLRTYRVEMQTLSNYHIQPLFIELGKRLDLPLDLVVALKPEEIERALIDPATLPSTNDLKVRSRNYGFRYDDKGIAFVTGKEEVDELERTELGVQSQQEIKELSGTSAYQGTMRGKVQIVLTKEQISTFSEGGILVTTMTTPEFVPIMRKAAAIVTDEGGVLCHAAIVARELKKPCIIGTKIATQVLKDGDEVEVDATKGIVKIIKRI